MCNDGIATDFEFEREVAYSREPNQPKQYVQNLLTRDAAKIYEMWVRYKKLSEYFSQNIFNHPCSGKEDMFTFVVRSAWLRVWRTH